jgi:hypothetical protein
MNPLLKSGGLYKDVGLSGRILDEAGIDATAEGWASAAMGHEAYFTGVLGQHAAGLFSACPNTGMRPAEAKFLNDNFKEGFGTLSVLPPDMRTDGVDAPKGFSSEDSVSFYEEITSLITKTDEPLGCVARGSALVLALQDLITYKDHVLQGGNCSRPANEFVNELFGAYDGLSHSLEANYGENIIDANWGFGLITSSKHAELDRVLRMSATLQCSAITALNDHPSCVSNAHVYSGHAFDRKFETNVKLTNSSDTDPPFGAMTMGETEICNLVGMY